MINNVVIVSGEQWRDSAYVYVYIYIYIYISILPQIPFTSRLACNTEQSSMCHTIGSMCYTIGFCWLSILNIAVYTCWHPQDIVSSKEVGYKVHKILNTLWMKWLDEYMEWINGWLQKYIVYYFILRIFPLVAQVILIYYCFIVYTSDCLFENPSLHGFFKVLSRSPVGIY